MNDNSGTFSALSKDSISNVRMNTRESIRLIRAPNELGMASTGCSSDSRLIRFGDKVRLLNILSPVDVNDNSRKLFFFLRFGEIKEGLVA